MRLSFLIILSLPAICFSQSTLDSEEFFAQGLSQFSQVEKIDGAEVTFPWIDRYEFRTETNEFDVEEQEFSLRLTPSTAKIRNAQKALYNQMRTAPDFDGQEIYCDYLLSLQVDWLALFTLQENMSLLSQLGDILDDKRSIYEKMAGSYDVDVQDLVKLQTEQSDIEVSTNKLRLKQEYLLSKYNLSGRAIDFGKFITVQGMLMSLKDSGTYMDTVAWLDSKKEYEKELLIKEMQLESAEGKRLLDFFQFRYNGPHSDPFRERFSLRLGFQLSNSGNDRLKRQELLIEQEELERESARDVQEKQSELIALRNKLATDIASFLHFRETIGKEREELQNLSMVVSQKEGISPLLLLQIEERHIATEIESISEKEDLLRDYLKYVHQSGKMCQGEFVNYLAL